MKISIQSEDVRMQAWYTYTIYFIAMQYYNKTFGEGLGTAVIF